MIGDLPLEIQVKLVYLVPTSGLKLVNSHFYGLYNDLFYNKIVLTYGEDILDVIIKVLPWLKLYIKSLDAFRYESRTIIAQRLNLHDQPTLDSIYIKDSWRYVYSVLKNKRLFAEYNDYKIDEPTNYVFNHFVEINRTYLLSYSKSIWLSPGNYNLNIGLVVKHGSGLGTTKFELTYESGQGRSVIQTFYPPTNINDILPKLQFCFLRLGEFTIPPLPNNANNKLYKVQLVMEEIGLYLKSGFRIFFIDVCQPSLLFNDYDLLYYSVKETDYKYFINLPLKNLYKALNYVQNGGDHDGLSQKEDQQRYGQGDPYTIMDQYDQEFAIPVKDSSDEKPILNVSALDLAILAGALGHAVPIRSALEQALLAGALAIRSAQGQVILAGEAAPEHSETNDKRTAHPYDVDDDTLMTYANFYYNNHYKKRFYKFNTIYQRRQFINRFGDFEIDWQEAEEPGKSAPRSCTYDEEGLKWKIPLIGEL